ncbi:MAG TPA: hypothetical protein VFS55_01465 [Dokdonella sp.]|nr:hypothetical protein [Dokdonella sp.]
MPFVRSLLCVMSGLAAAAFCPSSRALTIAPHPRLLLDGPTLANLRAKAAMPTTDWLKLKEQCDAYLGGSVALPAAGGGSSSPPNVGSGYEGEEYPPVLLAEALCYQTLRASDPAAAQPYGAKAVQILLAMATPPGQPGAANPCEDAGYVIRNYGVSYGLGYDWLFDLLTPAQRTQVHDTAKAWVTSYETAACSQSTYIHPLSNYFAGFFHAAAAIALATYDEDPGHALWNDWLGTQFNTAAVSPPHVGVADYFGAHMAGGGWPEGFGSYGPQATFGMSIPALEVRTATAGTLDLVGGAAGYRYPIDNGDYLLHFAWPSRTYIDDRDTNHANGDADHPPGTIDAGMLIQTLGQLRAWNAPHADHFEQFLDESTAALGADPYGPVSHVPNRWKIFLFLPQDGIPRPLDELPRSYFAPGMNALAARSDWSTSATWLSFRAGPYVEDPNHAEQYYDQGSLALVRGATPLLVNGTGWIVHEPDGDRGEYPSDFGCDTPDDESIYCDMFGNFVPGDPYLGNRTLPGVFFVRNMSGGTLHDRFGQEGAGPLDFTPPRTHVSRFEDRSVYVYALAEHLEDMYRPFAAGPAVAGWSRQILYIRPNRVAVFDRTTTGNASYDQYMAFDVAAEPVAAASPAGTSRLDVTTAQNAFAGSMTIVSPDGATGTAVEMYPGRPSGKVWQVQVRPNQAGATQKWVTVFDLAGSPAAVAQASKLDVVEGAVFGTTLTDANGTTALVSSSGVAGTPVALPVSYRTPLHANALHVVTDVQPNTAYQVSLQDEPQATRITISAGAPGNATSSAQGVLAFTTSAAGVGTDFDAIFADGFEP